MQLTPDQLYALNLQAGFSPAQAVIMTAIDEAESGGDDRNLGDLNLQTSEWGPSYGFPQIRTLKQETGTGTDRDIRYLSASDLNQARAAYNISSHGRDFSPWTTFTDGKYQKFMTQASAAGGAALPVDSGSGPFPTWGPSWLPWNIPGAIANAKYAQAVSGANVIAMEALFAALGVGLVILGLGHTFPDLTSRLKAVGK
jgi:hypothetical protein